MLSTSVYLIHSLIWSNIKQNNQLKIKNLVKKQNTDKNQSHFNIQKIIRTKSNMNAQIDATISLCYNNFGTIEYCG